MTSAACSSERGRMCEYVVRVTTGLEWPSRAATTSHAAAEQVRRRRMPHIMEAARANPGCLTVAPESVRQPLRVNKPAELVGEDQIPADVGVAGGLPLGHLALPVLLEPGGCSLVERSAGVSLSSCTLRSSRRLASAQPAA